MSLNCYHCDEPVLTGTQYQVEILGSMQTMCCPGCQSVASTIIENGLVSYYQYRTQPANKSDLVPEEIKALALYDNQDVQREFVHEDGNNKKVTLSLEGVSCAACAWLIEKHIMAQQGVIQISVNTSIHRAQLVWDQKQTTLSTVLSAIHQLGYKAAPFEASRQEAQFQKSIRRYLYKIGIAGVATMQVMMLAVALYMDLFNGIEEEYKHLFRWVSLVFATPVLLYSASPFYINAWRTLKARTLGMDVPVTLALLFAYLASCYATFTQQGEVYFESISMFTFFLLLGRFLELNAKHRAATANANLFTLIPQLATLTNGETLPAKALNQGMKVRVFAGEKIPADGKILNGMTSINESMLTGEPLPVAKAINDDVYAGTINVEGTIDVEVTAEYQDSLLANIVRLQNDALSTKPKLVLLADKVAKSFVAVILFTAALTWSYWYFHRPDDAFWIMLSVLVATCPCALSLATPTALTCATSTFSRLGLIVRSSHVFETLTKVNHVILDKTGTLTQGKIKIDSVHCFDQCTKEQALEIAAALESYSAHPIAKAFLSLEIKKIHMQNVENNTGKGISGERAGKHWRIGKSDFALYNEDAQTIDNHTTDYPIWLSCEGKKIAGFTLEDPIRDNSAAFITKLKKLNINITMLTGDNSSNAKKVSQQLRIDKLLSGASPKDKMDYVHSLDKSEISMMIGDGVNDAPVLSSAHLSVAMGGGTDIAKSAADLVLLGDDLSKLLSAYKLAQFTKRVIKQNLAWSLGYNALILPLAIAGMVSPYIAVIGMSASSVIVVVNSLRINDKPLLKKLS